MTSWLHEIGKKRGHSKILQLKINKFHGIQIPSIFPELHFSKIRFLLCSCDDHERLKEKFDNYVRTQFSIFGYSKNDKNYGSSIIMLNVETLH